MMLLRWLPQSRPVIRHLQKMSIEERTGTGKKLMTWENKRVLRRKMSQWMLLHGKIETPERETETEKKGERNREMSLAHTVHLDTERHLICDARANNLPLHPPVLFPLPISFISVSSIEDRHHCHNGLYMITFPRF